MNLIDIFQYKELLYDIHKVVNTVIQFHIQNWIFTLFYAKWARATTKRRQVHYYILCEQKTRITHATFGWCYICVYCKHIGQ